MSISYDYKLKNHFDYLVSLKESSVNFIKTFCTNFKIRTLFYTLKHLHLYVHYWAKCSMTVMYMYTCTYNYV